MEREALAEVSVRAAVASTPPLGGEVDIADPDANTTTADGANGSTMQCNSWRCTKKCLMLSLTLTMSMTITVTYAPTRSPPSRDYKIILGSIIT